METTKCSSPTSVELNSSGCSSSDSGSGGVGVGGGAGAQHATGYENAFVETVDEKYECPICCYVLRNPNQTKCGHRFCSACIKKWITEKTRPGQMARCPICSEVLAHADLFSDNFAKREILSLQVYCPHKKQGCDVIVELRDVQKHLGKCDYTTVPCPNGCSAVLMRKDVKSHVTSSCDLRLVTCPVCKKEVALDRQALHLDQECPMVEVACVMCSANVPRSKLESHKDVCPKLVVDCVFSSVGCHTKIERDQLDTHLHLSTQTHLKLLRDTVVTLKRYLPQASSSSSSSSTLSHSAVLLGSPEEMPAIDQAVAGVVGGHGQQMSFGSFPSFPSIRHDTVQTITSGSPYAAPLPSQRSSGGGGGGGHDSPLASSMYGGPLSSYALPDLAVPGSSIPTGYSDPLPPPPTTTVTPHRSQKQQQQVMMKQDNVQPPALVGRSADWPPRRLLRQSSLSGESSSGYSWPADGASAAAVSSSSRIQLLAEQCRDQQQQLVQQQQQLSSLQAQNRQLEQRAQEQEEAVQHLEEQLKGVELRNCMGTFVWKVSSYHLKKREAQNGTRTVIHSPGFYTHPFGYKLCVRLNPNGVEMATGTHLSLFIHFMQGDYDDTLDWPFSGHITLAILDQSESSVPARHHLTETLVAKPDLAAFQRPRSHRNHKGFGYVEFTPLRLIEGSNPLYVKNDTVFIRVEVVQKPTAAAPIGKLMS